MENGKLSDLYGEMHRSEGPVTKEVPKAVPQIAQLSGVNRDVAALQVFTALVLESQSGNYANYYRLSLQAYKAADEFIRVGKLSPTQVKAEFSTPVFK